MTLQRRFRGFRSLIGVAIAAAIATTAAAAPPSAADAEQLDAVLVTGEQPGPGLWKVSKNGHVLWVLGTWSPLPMRFTWRSKQTESIIAGAQLLLAMPRPKVDIGWFEKLTLLPSLLGARDNADGARLADIVPADLHARWSILKARYIGADDGIESRRPLLASFTLYRKALKASGLTLDDDVASRVEHIARDHRVPVKQILIELPLEDPRGALAEFKAMPREAEIACMRTTLDRVEFGIEALKQGANAWATGDIADLRRVADPTAANACFDAFSSTPALRGRFAAATAQIADGWINAAEGALAANTSTFALLPMAIALKADGPMQILAEKGYEVEAPE